MIRRYLYLNYPRYFHFLKMIGYQLRPKKLPKLGWNCRIHPTAVFEGHVDGVVLEDKVRIQAHARIFNRKGCEISIGENSTIAPYAMVTTQMENTTLQIGSNCTLQSFSIINAAGPVKIGNHVRIACHTSFHPTNKRFDEPDAPIRDQGSVSLGIHLGDDIWIGAGVQILDGVTIGDGCVVAAGAVVTRSFGPNSLIAGVPARLIRHRGSDGENNPSLDSNGSWSL